MNITAENARIKVEIDEKTINDSLKHYIPEASFKIEKSGKITLAGKYGILPFKITIDEVKHDAKQISLILQSNFANIITFVLLKLLKEECFHFNLLSKELYIDVYQLIKSPNSTIPSDITINDIVIEKCFTEESKVTIILTVSGEYKIS